MDKIKPTAFVKTLTKEQQLLIKQALMQRQRVAPDQLLNTDNNLNYRLNVEESRPAENYWIYEVSDSNGPKNLDEMREMPDVAIQVNLDMLMEPYASGLDNFRWKTVDDAMNSRLSDLEDVIDWRLLLGWNDMNKVERFVKKSDDFGNVIDWNWDGKTLVINTMSGVERYSRSDLRESRVFDRKKPPEEYSTVEPPTTSGAMTFAADEGFDDFLYGLIKENTDEQIADAIDTAEQALLDSGWKKSDLFVMDDEGEIIDSNHPQFTDDMDVTGYTQAARDKFEEYYNIALENVESGVRDNVVDSYISHRGKRRRRKMVMTPEVDLLINEVLDENRRRAGVRGSVADRYAANAVQSALIKEALAQGASFKEAFAASQGKFWRKGVHEVSNEYGNPSTVFRLQKNLMKAMRPEMHRRKGSSRFRNIRTPNGTRKYNYVGTGKNANVSKLAHLLRNKGYYARVIPNTRGHGLYLNKKG